MPTKREANEATFLEVTHEFRRTLNTYEEESMHKRIGPDLVCAAAGGGPAFAQFEGVLEMKMTMAGKGSEGGAAAR